MRPKARTKTDDRRVRKTRAQLREALIALALAHGWDAVSVRDVCVRADVGRSTFYAHFADKEDLLLSGFDDLHASLDHVRRGSDTPFAFAEALLVHAVENEDLMRLVAGRESAQQMQWRFRDVVHAMVHAELGKLPAAQRAHTARFVAGGFVEMLMGWLESPRRASPAELAAAFRRLALAAISARS